MEFEIPAEMRREFRRTPEGGARVWNLDHAGDKFTLDPHPSVDEALGYQPDSPSLLSMISALFMHPDLQIIKGLKLIAINLLFLWVFGRALEDTLGRGLFLGAYFVCGLAATLMYHVMVKNFAPAQASVPFSRRAGLLRVCWGCSRRAFTHAGADVLHQRDGRAHLLHRHADPQFSSQLLPRDGRGRLHLVRRYLARRHHRVGRPGVVG
jgi:hypothetical protein